MASISVFIATLIVIASISTPTTFTATVVEDLNNLQPPPDFNTTIANNCRSNPFLRYCNSTPFNLLLIFKSTIVASHLCNISNNPNCVDSFPTIDLRSRPNIAPLYLSFDFFWRYCPLTILSIDLSNNSLRGSFPNELFYCSQIRDLDLSLNRLSGDVPVEEFSSLKNLTSLNLSYNDFSRCRISETRFFESFNPSSFLHSGVLPDHGELRVKAVAFPAAMIAAAVLCFLWFCFCRESCGGGKEHIFKAWVVEEASGGLSKRNLARKSGNVYRGVLRDGREVGIEVFPEKMRREDRRRFAEKFELLFELRHPNIVRVLGWCDSRRFMAVVTQWIDDRNDIETWIRSCTPPWKQRVQAISGIATAIRYLHEEAPQIGYDIKARNLLISQNGEPLITRFEFDDHIHHHSGAKRMYQFGVLVFEIVTNRWDLGKKETGVVEWVKPGNMEDLIDGRMEKTVEMVSTAAQVLQFGLTCVDLSSRPHPSWDKFCHLLLNISYMHLGRGHKHVHHRHR